MLRHFVFGFGGLCVLGVCFIGGSQTTLPLMAGAFAEGAVMGWIAYAVTRPAP
jgi:hypothetical protein